MSRQWYYRLFGEEFGPVPRESLQELAAKGTLGSSDEVRADGSSEWLGLEQALATIAVAPGASTIEIATITAESADDELNWYYQFMGDEMGPVSFNELLSYAHTGQLTADDEVKFGERGKWRRLGAIGRLVAVLPYQDHALTPRPPTKTRAPAVELPADDSDPILEPEAAVAPAPPIPAAPAVPPPPRYLSAAEEKTWYAWIRGTEFGPSNLLELNQWITSGQIAPTDFVRYGMMGQWAPPGAALQALAQLRMPDPVGPVAPPPKPTPVAPPVPVAAAPVSAAPSPPKATSAVKLPEPSEVASPPTRTSNPSAETVKTSPVAKTSNPVTDVVEEPSKPSPPPEERKPEPRPAMDPPRSPSAYGGGGGMSSPPAWQSPSKPAYKPPPRKSSSGGSGMNFGALLEPLKDGKTLGIIGGMLVVGLLVAGWMFMPASTGADVARLKQLEELLANFRKIRDQKGDFASFTAEAAKVTKPIVDDLKNTANRKSPAKQCLLWAARDAFPRMMSAAQQKINPAEKEFEGHLFEAARILHVGNPPPRQEPSAAADEAP